MTINPAVEPVIKTDEDGYVVLRLGLIITLYFRAGHALAKRRAVVDCFNDYIALCGEHLHWQVTDGEEFSAVTSSMQRTVAPYLLAPTLPAVEDGWAFFWHGGARAEDASEFRIFGFGQPQPRVEESDALKELEESEETEDLSFLTATVPPQWAFERPEMIAQLIRRWAERLQPLHGYAGIGIVDAADDGLASVNEDSVYALAMRCPGLEVDYPLDHCLYTAQGIKGGSWITVLADEFVDRLGGVESLLPQLGAPFRVENYVGGAIIVAGDQPEIGDRNRQIDTPNYRRLARALKPIRIVAHAGVGESFEDWFNAEEFESWLRRFDEE